MSLKNAADPALERGRLRVVIATIAINVVVVSLLTFAPWSDWRTGAALNLVDNCLLLGFVLAKRDALLARFLVFGLVVGIAELPGDAWLVDYTRTLDYSIRWQTDDLAVAALDAAGVGSCGGAIRIHRPAIVGAFWQARFAHHRGTRRDQHSVLRRNGPKDSLVAIHRLPNDLRSRPGTSFSANSA